MISSEPVEQLAADLRLTIGRVARRLRQLAPGDLTPSQRSALATLERHGPLRLGDLARIEVVTPPSITGIAKRLEDKGMIIRTPDPDDGRSTVIAISDKGRATLQAVRRQRMLFLIERLGELSEAERSAVRDVLDILNSVVREA